MKNAFYVSLALTGLAIFSSIWAVNFAPPPSISSSELPGVLNGEMPPAFGLAVDLVFLGLAATGITGALLAVSKLQRRGKSLDGEQ